MAIVGEYICAELDALLFRSGRWRWLAALRDADAGSLGLIDEVELLARIDELVLRPGCLQLRERAAVEGALERMVDKDERARHAHLEFSDRRSAGRDRRGLNIVCRRGQVAFGIDRVEDLADGME